MLTLKTLRMAPWLFLFISTPWVQAGPAASAGEKVIWDNWYTVSIEKPGGSIHYEYYNDHLELKKGRLYSLNKTWKKEEDYINEEQLGAFAENTPDLTPLFYNFHSTFKTTETTIDGNTANGKLLAIKIRKPGAPESFVKKTVGKGTFFSVFFPVWLKARLPLMKQGQTKDFNTILEDSVDTGFATVEGQVTLQKPDAFADKTKTRKLLVQLGMKTYWWVTADGYPLKMEIPEHHTIIELVPKETAEKFLNE